jgi:hypothetical protein
VRFHRSSHVDAPNIGGSGEKIHKVFGFGTKLFFRLAVVLLLVEATYVAGIRRIFTIWLLKYADRLMVKCGRLSAKSRMGFKQLRNNKYESAAAAPSDAPAGSRVAAKRPDKAMRLGVLAAITVGSMMLAPAARAVTLLGTITAPSFTDTFDIESNGGSQSSDPESIFFPIFNDLHGFTAVTFGDGVINGRSAIGTAAGADTFTEIGADFLSPLVWDGQDPLSFNLQPGTYNGSSGATLTLTTLTPMPEPTTRALLIAGAMVIGGVSSLKKHRRPSAMSA